MIEKLKPNIFNFDPGTIPLEEKINEIIEEVNKQEERIQAAMEVIDILRTHQ